MPNISYTNLEKQELSIEVDRLPDVCPVCDKGNEFKCLYAYYKKDRYGERVRLQVLFRCPRQECQILFFVFYHDPYPMNRRFSGDEVLYLQKFGMMEYLEEPKFPEPIPDVSPKFVRIFFQASMADENGLDEISGIAYGKALEFLIKDFLIHMNPGKDEEIKKELKLAKLIDQIKDPDIQTVADRATWLRNDETHYVRIWVNQDIEDLKQLIELTVSYIRRAMLTGKYKKEMPDPKKKEA